MWNNSNWRGESVWYASVEGIGHAPNAVSRRVAFRVHCVLSADSEEEAVRRIRVSLAQDHLHLIQVNEIEPFELNPHSEDGIHADLAPLARRAGEDGSSVQFAGFHTWSA